MKGGGWAKLSLSLRSAKAVVVQLGLQAKHWCSQGDRTSDGCRLSILLILTKPPADGGVP